MNDENLYPELMDYIYYHQREFMTKDEIVAGKTVMYVTHPEGEHLAFLKSKGMYGDEPHIKEMIAGGHEAFKRQVVIRIFVEHREELNLNLCPKCNKIARTPLAKQCRFCFHDWH